MISEQPQGTVIRVGKVVKVHIEDHSLDIVMLDNGARYHHVPALSASAGTRAGRVDLPEPDPKDANNPWSQAMTETFDILAVVAMTSLMPVCLGYLYQPVNQLAMPKETKNLRIDRHASDVYTATDDSANTATHHPYGAYFSIGESGTPKIEKGGDFDQQWEIKRNTDKEAALVQYTPMKAQDEVELDGSKKVIGYGRAEVSPQRVQLEVKQRGDHSGITINAQTISAHAINTVLINADNHDITAQAGNHITAKAQAIFLN